MFRVSFFLLLCNTVLAQLPVPITVPFVYLINLDTGKVIHEKNSDQLIYPASTTKIATALYILSKEIDLNTVVTCNNKRMLEKISPKKKVENHFTDAPYLLEYDGVSFGLKYGEEMTLRDLLFGLMITSGNDVANVLAEFISGDVETFCIELNAFLKTLGLERTHFVNPHGLHHPEHVSTPKDMVLLAQHALKNEVLQGIVGCATYSIGATNKHAARDIRQGNKLLLPGPFYYEKAFGVKTGNHLRAGKCLVAAAKDDSRVVLGGFFKAKDWNECFGDAITLFDAAFREKVIRRYLFRGGESSFFYTLKNEKIRADLLEDVSIEYYPSEAPALQTALVWNAIALPIKAGEVIGYIRVYDDDMLLQEIPLHANRDYKKESTLPFWMTILALTGLGLYFFVRRLRAVRTV